MEEISNRGVEWVTFSESMRDCCLDELMFFFNELSEIYTHDLILKIEDSCEDFYVKNNGTGSKIEDLKDMFSLIFVLFVKKSMSFKDSFDVFKKRVLDHIEKYTVPQYGDMPGDQIESWTSEEVVKNIRKRCKRYGKNSRLGQEKLDILKMAHECCIAFSKLRRKS